MSKRKHYGLSVSMVMDGEGNADGDSVGYGCYGDWKAQQKCPFFMGNGYVDPPMEGDTCIYMRDGFQCGNPRAIVAALDKARKVLKAEMDAVKKECWGT